MGALLKNQFAIVTGGAKGIGFAVAQSLGKAGAKVMLADVDQQAGVTAVEKLQEAGIEATYTACDVSSKQDVDRLIDHTVQQLGGVDIMVANAGMPFHWCLPLFFPVMSSCAICDMQHAAKGRFVGCLLCFVLPVPAASPPSWLLQLCECCACWWDWTLCILSLLQGSSRQLHS